MKKEEEMTILFIIFFWHNFDRSSYQRGKQRTVFDYFFLEMMKNQ